ncbi:HAMP domain-containing histidine kinase [Natronosporangium hydrolyticum]|uniref:histidine kinase n=1 Tax=Natronosporangium hydrolyticum TaxID=2811111 RepID=A0A895YGU8_9ACTN|nr:HAMP domain-containing sensor histidine kinase [Natronosporangium hydrolyticum]QSB13400.1 HAMP domain-containing histidine kinase [Natronosporangium hydrolyticum]
MTTTDRHQRWRPVVSLRLRLLGWALLLLAVASLGSVVVVRQVLLNQLENRTTADLQQEVSEFRLLAGGRDPTTGEPFGTDLGRIADTYLERNEPQEGEAVFIFVNGAFYGASPDPPFDLTTDPALTNSWTSLRSSQYGEIEQSPAGGARWLAVPVTIEDELQGHVVVVQFTAERRAEIDRAVQLMAFACLLVIVVVAAGGYLAMGRALRPLRTVTEAAREIEESDLSRRIEVSGSDEVAHLGRTFNGMLGRLERAFAAQQDFLSDVGHELRTPITIVRGHLEVMGDDPQERRETVALVTDELDRMNRMVDDLLMLARAERPDFLQLAQVDVAAVLSEVYTKATALGDRDWQLGRVDAVVTLADRHRLTQALMQLVQNAVQFTEAGDRITLAAEAYYGELALSVSDTGIGISPADREMIFERFGRADSSGIRGGRGADGVGLGLAIVTAIATAHRGSVTVASELGVGSTFTLLLPLTRPPGPDEMGA